MINSVENLIFDTQIDTEKMYVSMKTKFIPRSYNKEVIPLYLHITGLGTRERLNLDIDIQKKYWDQDNQRLSIPPILKEEEKQNLKDTNLVIENVASKVTKIKTVYRLSEQILTPQKLKKELIEDLPRVNFCSFFENALKDEKHKLEPGTYRKLKGVLSKLKRYDEFISFSDLTLNWFESYKTHLYRIGNKKTTVNSNIKCIKKFLRIALRHGIKFPCNIDDIKAGSTLGVKVALTPNELKRLKKYYQSEFISENHALILGYFLFSCVTGLRFGDVMEIDRESIKDGFLQFKAEKVDKLQSVTLNKTAKKLVKKNKKLFVKKFTNEHSNRELKIIMKRAKINKKVTFHVSRHTFATSFLRAGGKIEKLRLLLGHSDLRQVMIYNHIVAAEANEEIFLLDNLF